MGSFPRFSRTVSSLLAGLLLLAAAAAPALASQRDARTTRLARRGARAAGPLSLEERVAYQRALEEVYWRHKIWPAENARPKPPLDEVMPPTEVCARAEDALRLSAAVEAEYRRPITPARLQAEMDRMAERTRQPELLRELWAALGDDPYVIAECLARPALAERLLRNGYAYDERRHAETRARAEAALAAVSSPEGLRGAGGVYEEVEMALGDGAAKPAPEDRALRLSRDEWDAMLGELSRSFTAGGPSDPAAKGAAAGAAPAGAAPAGVPLGRVGRLVESETRFSAVAVLSMTDDRVRLATASWEKRPFDAWWAESRARFAPAVPPAAAYEARTAPSGACADDTWRPTAEQMPGRNWHTAIWTGTEMIVWGGTPLPAPGDYSPAGRYDPATDTWTTTSSAGAPAPREKHTAVWTGTEMIVWGGNYDVISGPGTGGRYNPQSDTWAPLPASGVPSTRQHHTAVWTGSRMLVWGGQTDQLGDVVLNDGASYDPAADRWSPLPTSGAPSPRSYHTAVWTGTEMVVWGGANGAGASTNTGGRFDPAQNRWRPTATAGAPAARYGQSAVWTGAQMIVWGGAPAFFAANRLNSGGRYDPATDAWTPTATAGAPGGRDAHVAVWTGSQMLVWGGFDGQDRIRTGGRYTPASDSWSPITNVNAPEGGALAEAVWTGEEMVVWGGQSPPIASVVNTGGRYDPRTDTWAPVTPTPNGGVRNEHPAVWTGTEMIVWGSYENFTIPTNTGSRYAPATDTWRPTSMVGVPVDRYAPVAVWTGTEMVVWGGCDDPFCFTRLNSGGRYNPQTDSWRPTSMAGAPDGRYWLSAVWTGSEVLVWGGCDAQTCGPGQSADPDGSRTGGRYDPVTDTWRPMPVTAATPSGRWGYAAAWTGRELIVWGGEDGRVGALGDGGRYDPTADAWRPMTAARAPVARWGHDMVWTGSEAVVWGGTNSEDDYYEIVTGGRYDPATDSWRPTSTAGAPSGRSGQTMVWTGSEAIVWGGCRELNCQRPLQTGGRYNPVTDSWVATSTANAPPARNSHSAVWTGSEMIVFGGEWGARNPTVFDSGGRYCLAAPSFDLACSPSSLQAERGAQASTTCTVTSANGFAGAVSLSCQGLPASVTASFGGSVVTPPAGGSAESTLTFTVADGAQPGVYAVRVEAASGGLLRTQSVELTVPGAAPAGGSSIGVYSPANGTFFLRNANSSGPAEVLFGFGPGGLGWAPLSGDWDGDGADTAGLYDPSTGAFFLGNDNAAGPADVVLSFGPGGQGWVALSGDWDGDGVDTVGLYAPATGSFFLKNSNATGPAETVFGFGPAGLVPVAGDWDGDGVDTIGLYVPATGAFFLKNSNAAGAADAVVSFGPGGLGWRPISGDWDGDGADTVGLYDPANGAFFLRNANASGPAEVLFGYGPAGLGWAPIAGDWDGQ